MVNWVAIVTIVAIIGSIECNHPHHEPPADDSFADFARVHFMDKKRDEFMEMLPGVQSAIANNLNQFCKEGDCDTDVANFTSEHVDFYGANEKEKFFEDGRFIITKLFVKTGRDKVLSKEKVGEFIKTYRDKVVEEGKVQIAYINEELVYPQRNNIDNWIIVIASCLFCIILVSINLACTFKHAKIAKREFLTKAAQEKRPIVRREPNPVYLPNTIETNEEPTPESKLLLVAAKPPPAPQQTTIQPVQAEPTVQPTVNKPVERAELVNSVSNEPVSQPHRHHHHHHHHEKNGSRPHSHKKKKTNGGGGAASGAGIPSSNSSTIVGNVGSGLGSPRNITTEYQTDDDQDPDSRIQVISSRRPVKAGNMNSSNSTYTMYKNATTGEVQIPIQRVDRIDYEPQHQQSHYYPPNIGRGSYTNVNLHSGGSGSRGNLNSGSRRNVTTLSEYSDSKVAYRLASTEHL